jgi:hypothetical protein
VGLSPSRIAALIKGKVIQEKGRFPPIITASAVITEKLERSQPPNPQSDLS